MTGTKITGIGTALPEKVVTNADLAELIDTTDEWIRDRTGIRERRVGAPTTTMGIEAGRNAMEMAGVGPDDIDVLVVQPPPRTSVCQPARPPSRLDSISAAAHSM